MTLIESIILGIIEGVTEFLPISSTGHLILASKFLSIGQNDFVKSFEITIQFGAILSVVVLYWKSFLNLRIIKKLVASFIPTGIIGWILYEIIKNYLLENHSLVLASIFIGGLILIIFEFWHKEKYNSVNNLEQISYKQSLLIGFFQAVSIIPGISRSAASIIGGLLVGLNRKTVVEFSFLLAVPTMLAASGFDFIKTASSFSADQLNILAVGFMISFIVAMISIKFLLQFVEKYTFIPFGIYRILLAMVFWLVILG